MFTGYGISLVVYKKYGRRAGNQLFAAIHSHNRIYRPCEFRYPFYSRNEHFYLFRDVDWFAVVLLQATIHEVMKSVKKKDPFV